MGLDYSLCALLRRSDSPGLLSSLAELLDASSRGRIADLVWSPASEAVRLTRIGTSETDARGIAGLELGQYEDDNYYCLSLHVQLEQEMKAHVPDHRFGCFKSPGPFGCMWTSVFAGAKYLLIQATAATSGMSLVLRDSEAIHAQWRGFARATNAVLAYIDLEDAPAVQLHPGAGELVLPDYHTLSFVDDYQFSIDLFGEYLCRTNLA